MRTYKYDYCVQYIGPRTFYSKSENGRNAVVLVGSATLERVSIIRHLFNDDKYCSSYDSSTDQVCPLIRRFWITVC